MEKFARTCSATGIGFNAGYCVNDGELYFADKEHLVKWLRSRNTDESNELSDEFLMNEAYELGEYYYSEWDADDEDDEG